MREQLIARSSANRSIKVLLALVILVAAGCARENKDQTLVDGVNAVASAVKSSSFSEGPAPTMPAGPIAAAPSGGYIIPSEPITTPPKEQAPSPSTSPSDPRLVLSVGSGSTLTAAPSPTKPSSAITFTDHSLLSASSLKVLEQPAEFYEIASLRYERDPVVISWMSGMAMKDGFELNYEVQACNNSIKLCHPVAKVICDAVSCRLEEDNVFDLKVIHTLNSGNKYYWFSINYRINTAIADYYSFQVRAVSSTKTGNWFEPCYISPLTYSPYTYLYYGEKSLTGDSVLKPL